MGDLGDDFISDAIMFRAVATAIELRVTDQRALRWELRMSRPEEIDDDVIEKLAGTVRFHKMCGAMYILRTCVTYTRHADAA